MTPDDKCEMSPTGLLKFATIRLRHARIMRLPALSIQNGAGTGETNSELEEGTRPIETPENLGTLYVDMLLGLPVEDILRIACENGATAVRVFGSRARGDDNAASDLDLLVRLGPGRSLIDLVGMKLELENCLGIRVDVVTEQALSPYMPSVILAEAKDLVVHAA